MFYIQSFQIYLKKNHSHLEYQFPQIREPITNLIMLSCGDIESTFSIMFYVTIQWQL